MPFHRRATASVAALGIAAMIAVGGCGGKSSAAGFCAQAKHGHAAFDSINADNSKRALAQFNRVSASAPAAVAPDLKTVSTVLSLLYENPKAVAQDPAMVTRFTTAIDRVDRYLTQSCHVHIPKRVKLATP